MSRVLLTTSGVIRTPCSSGPEEPGGPPPLGRSSGAVASRPPGVEPGVVAAADGGGATPRDCRTLRPAGVVSKPRSLLDVTDMPDPGAIWLLVWSSVVDALPRKISLSTFAICRASP